MHLTSVSTSYSMWVCREKKTLGTLDSAEYHLWGAVGLTIACYVGTDELRSIVTLARDLEPLKMEEKHVANTTCPCQV